MGKELFKAGLVTIIMSIVLFVFVKKISMWGLFAVESVVLAGIILLFSVLAYLGVIIPKPFANRKGNPKTRVGDNLDTTGFSGQPKYNLSNV